MIEILLSLILAFTGISRNIDPELTAFAQQRAVAVQSDWSHNGMVYHEVLTYNDPERGGYDPVQRAVEQWRGSPSHWAILSNPELTRIGCAMSIGDDGWNNGVHYFVCVLDYGVLTITPQPVTISETPAPVGQAPDSEAPVVTLPDTAMAYEKER